MSYCEFVPLLLTCEWVLIHRSALSPFLRNGGGTSGGDPQARHHVHQRIPGHGAEKSVLLSAGFHLSGTGVSGSLLQKDRPDHEGVIRTSKD